MDASILVSVEHRPGIVSLCYNAYAKHFCTLCKERKDENSLPAWNYNVKLKREHMPASSPPKFPSLNLGKCDVIGIDDDSTIACHHIITIHKT